MIISKYYNYNQVDEVDKIFLSVSMYIFISIVITGFFSFMLAGYDLVGHNASDKNFSCFFSDWWNHFIGSPSFCIGFVSFLIQTNITIVNYLHKKFITTENSICDSLRSYHEVIDKKIDEHLKNARIIFETGIKDFDDAHLLALQKILNELDKRVSNIYLIDHSDPIQWWSDSMTGYLSLLAKWRADCGANNRRQIHRIFIFSKNELCSPVTRKTIAFHSLLGFHTYIFEEEEYKFLFEEYKKISGTECNIRMKEILLWDAEPDLHPVSFKLEKYYTYPWENIIFYQSFWDIDQHQKRERNDLMQNTKYKWLDYHGEPIEKEKIKIWFEFIPKNSLTEIMAKQQLDLIKFLISKSYCCRHDHELNKLKNGQLPL